MVTIIDDRGRVFGRVNVIDLLVLLLGTAVVTAGLTVVSDSPVGPLVALIGGALLFAGLAYAEREQTGSTDTAESAIQIEVEATALHPAVAAAISPGDTTTTDDVTVVDVQFAPTTVFIQTADGTLVEQSHPRQQTATVVLQYEPNGSPDQFRGERLYIGRPLTLALDRVQLDATVISFGEQ